MTNHEHLAEPATSYPSIEQRSNTKLGCDEERMWLSKSERCMGEVRQYRSILAQRLQRLFELQQNGVSLNAERQQATTDTREIEIGIEQYNLEREITHISCGSTLNFIIACNRLARADRLVVNVDDTYPATLDPVTDEAYMQKLATYSATSEQKNLRVHSRCVAAKGREHTLKTKPIQDFRPTAIELRGDALLMRDERTRSSPLMQVEEVLYVGPKELELLDFSDTRDNHHATI